MPPLNLRQPPNPHSSISKASNSKAGHGRTSVDHVPRTKWCVDEAASVGHERRTQPTKSHLGSLQRVFGKQGPATTIAPRRYDARVSARHEGDNFAINCTQQRDEGATSPRRRNADPDYRLDANELRACCHASRSAAEPVLGALPCTKAMPPSSPEKPP